jgi:DNA-binding response OmpR family regulator
LLHHLKERSGKACSREELLADVWGMWFDPGSNLVDVTIRRVRHKLGSEIIETVRGVGYRIPA